MVQAKGDLMKAWQLHGLGIENLRVTTGLPVPQPGPHEVLLRISAVSLNYRDKLVVEGLYNPSLRFPMTQVADAVGEVVDVGRDVSRFRKGDRIITLYATKWIDGEPQGDENTHTLGSTISGALAEYIVLNEEAAVLAPEYLSDEEAAALPCASLTAWYALVEKGGLKEGQTVLVQGTGGVSLFGLQIAKALGATVIVTSSSDEKLDRAKKLGASYGINYTRVPEWEKAVLEATAQKGVDHILEVAGGKSVGQSLKAIKPGGQISIIGLLADVTAEFPLFSLFRKQAVLRGISTGPRSALERMTQALSRMGLRPVIDQVYQFDDALSAYAHLYRGSFGKIVIHV
jgi:NADPH:quinone reductase-like Zn-dependent oxidoreductase